VIFWSGVEPPVMARWRRTLAVTGGQEGLVSNYINAASAFAYLRDILPQRDAPARRIDRQRDAEKRQSDQQTCGNRQNNQPSIIPQMAEPLAKLQ
jgi:hypothetical protein